MSTRVKITAKRPETKRDNSVSQTRKTDSSRSTNSPVDQILFLQRTIGNQAVQRLLKSGVIQAKLRIGQPNDIYEQEADRVADEVMRMPEPGLQRQVEPEEEEEEETLQPKPLVSQITPLVQVQSQEEPEEEVETLQAKPLAEQITPLVQRQVEKEEEKKEEIPIMAKSLSGEVPQISDALEERLSRTKGLGNPLLSETRAFMEERFGIDFSAVKIHVDNNVAQIARGLNAEAFTHGQDIYFRAGKYSPTAVKGKRLLAHELSHVQQQSSILQQQRNKDSYVLRRQVKRTKAQISSPIQVQGRLERNRIQRVNGAGQSPGQLLIPTPRDVALQIVAGQLSTAQQISQQIRNSVRFQVQPPPSLSIRQMFIHFIDQALSPVIENIVIPAAEGVMRFSYINRVLEWFGVDQSRVREAIREGAVEAVVDGIRDGIIAGVGEWIDNSIQDETARSQLGNAFESTFTRMLEYREGELEGVGREDFRRRLMAEVQSEHAERRGRIESHPSTIPIVSVEW